MKILMVLGFATGLFISMVLAGALLIALAAFANFIFITFGPIAGSAVVLFYGCVFMAMLIVNM